MNWQLSANDWQEQQADWLIVCNVKDAPLSEELKTLDERLGGAISRLRDRGDLPTKSGEMLILPDTGSMAIPRVLLLGLGSLDSLKLSRFSKAFAVAAKRISEKSGMRVTLVAPVAGIEQLGVIASVSALVSAMEVGCVGPGLYQREPKRHPLASATLVVAKADEIWQQALDQGQILGEAVNLTRELVNRAPDDIYPESVADRARQVAEQVGIRCEVFDEKRLEQERMGSLLAVARGSDRPPRLVILEYRGADANPDHLALVGKGVTFDSGGLSLKPTDGMKEMKCDMAGAATVLGAMQAIAKLKLPVNVTGYLGLVENMVSGRSYKLGDVLTARNGVTIEVLNTDAEGRLVLADVLSLAVDRGASRMVDLATLTGACVVALGEEVTGLFTNHQGWGSQVLRAAETVGEDIWQMPMFDGFSDQLKSDVADCKNVGTRWGGAITAAKFLEKFVSGVPWVHLDIAGPSFASSGNASRDSGATGCMLQTLVALIGNSSQAE